MLAKYLVLQAKKHPSLAPVVFDVWQEAASSSTSLQRLSQLYTLAKYICETSVKSGVTALIQQFDMKFHAVARNHLETRTKDISTVVIAIDQYIAQGMKLFKLSLQQQQQQTTQKTPSVQTPSTSSTTIISNHVKTEPSKLFKPVTSNQAATTVVTPVKSEVKPAATRLVSTPPTTSNTATRKASTSPNTVQTLASPSMTSTTTPKPEKNPTSTTNDHATSKRKRFLKEHKNALIEWFNQHPQHASESFFYDDDLVNKFISENQHRFSLPLTPQTLKNNKDSPHFRTFFQAKYLGERLVKQEQMKQKNPAQKRANEASGASSFEQQKRKK
ncbi:hypothetical protein C9374_004335 [Naegleria lovaniensis]|uniref:Uncharacterized protein n=1 Tax=Naegleria lovaniensis TaxID=51637 RepID=A0AA88GR58_NAELO|nr:uncharacterized protein C9374_004335 [Naegleria lovaniensis]KAG2383664.1 hypothetical protein C9374_004335 [Naegleria lovaniensis]